jgi:hypothetical protein
MLAVAEKRTPPPRHSSPPYSPAWPRCPAHPHSARAKSHAPIPRTTGVKTWKTSAVPHADSSPRTSSKLPKTTKSLIPQPPKGRSVCDCPGKRSALQHSALRWREIAGDRVLALLLVLVEQVRASFSRGFEGGFVPPFFDGRMVAAEEDFGDFPALVIGGAGVVGVVEDAG